MLSDPGKKFNPPPRDYVTPKMPLSEKAPSVNLLVSITLVSSELYNPFFLGKN